MLQQTQAEQSEESHVLRHSELSASSRSSSLSRALEGREHVDERLGDVLHGVLEFRLHCSLDDLASEESRDGGLVDRREEVDEVVGDGKSEGDDSDPSFTCGERGEREELVCSKSRRKGEKRREGDEPKQVV